VRTALPSSLLACKKSVPMKRILGLVFASLIFLPGCGESSKEALRIGINAWPGYEFLYLAATKGYFEAEGVPVKILEFDSLADARRAFERGQLDGFATTVVEVLQARDESNRRPQVFQVIDYSEGADVVIAHPSIGTMADLKGKRVGVELASLGVFMLARSLEKAGLTLDDVVAVSSDQVAMAEEFLAGNLDAVVTYPPRSLELLRDGKAKIVFSSSELPGEIVDVIAVDAEVIARRPEDVKRVSRAFYRAVEFARSNKAEAYGIMGAREGISAQEFEEALQDGIRIVQASEQESFLGTDGKLGGVVESVDRILRATKQITGPDRTSGSFILLGN
jgi:NitT/TauT family transport system substrate-binding protein